MQTTSISSSSPNYTLNKLCSGVNLTIIVLVALSIISLGAVAYLKGINCLKLSFGLPMIGGGLFSLAIAFTLCLGKQNTSIESNGFTSLGRKKEIASLEEALKLCWRLNKQEFFFFNKRNGSEVVEEIFMHDPNGKLGNVSADRYAHLISEGYRLVTLEELRSRSE